jgi:hypothetical protein
VNALLIVDVQNDFMPFGSLPVVKGNEVVPVANKLAPHFEIVIATQDWHPASHGSFASNHPGATPGDLIDLGGIEQVLWPDHCVQNSPGASFHSGLDITRIRAVIRKGTDPGIDSYSGFLITGTRTPGRRRCAISGHRCYHRSTPTTASVHGADGRGLGPSECRPMMLASTGPATAMRRMPRRYAESRRLARFRLNCLSSRPSRLRCCFRERRQNV